LSRSNKKATGLLVIVVLLVIPACDEGQPSANDVPSNDTLLDASSDVSGSDTALDVSSECMPTCVDTYALAFNFDNECVPTNTAEIHLGCLLIDPCNESYHPERSCYISPEHDAIVIYPNQYTYPDVALHLTSQLGWVNCEDVIEVVPQEFENMFPVCE